ncbi:hypothetical protein [Alkaliphilus oremlandii]|uniref:Uncharacterized protein n=1 Tax=Alkaliphilus oremlandii (strain OhILAs) TaxID=350688 RepID=A8MJI8_ALKOO|nr:hypothetical protein [Alkaliphilus oremlandii]ABW19970.1 conserved hypothetical protein [Alkaliphilus oremlandii OhILAs]
MYQNFITVEMLATFAGLVAAVTLIVQFSKTLIKNRFGDVAIRIYTFMISLILTFAFARVETGMKGIVLTVVNAIIITMASMGGYEMITDPKALKKRVEP